MFNLKDEEMKFYETYTEKYNNKINKKQSPAGEWNVFR